MRKRPDRTPLGDALSAWRWKHGVTITQMRETLGLTNSELWQLEHGARLPPGIGQKIREAYPGLLENTDPYLIKL